ncbi:mast cell protease 1A-like [Vombatus ursinus]|uniref:Cathepsin G n=1 Tax=Vombatus ursinus TaxID=29139 RepID=A0A4X2JN81_VOMUR|nr:mast cell protease 1A-like [Vombatus ursinus]
MHFLLPLLLTFLQSAGAKAGAIIGGQEAKPHSRPYMAYLKYKNEIGREHTCGAFLVREDFLLTAAHCWGSSISIILGAHNIQKPEETQQQIPVLRAIRHQLYDNQAIKNDIMLLQLEKKAKLNNAVGLLALPQKKDWVRPGKICSVAGWGSNLERKFYTLQKVKLEVRKAHECMEKYPKNYNSFTQICAGDPKEQKASFKGDSGGPLVCDGVAQGIVSYGFRNGSNPRVYTRISSFLPWIKKTMRAHEC